MFEQLITTEFVAAAYAEIGVTWTPEVLGKEVAELQKIERNEGFCRAEQVLGWWVADAERDMEADGREAAAFADWSYGDR